MNAEQVRIALSRRWPDTEYLSIAEAPQDAMRQGRKLDVLVLSLWASRGHQLDGIEIKVSLSDWKRERDDGAKADWWWAHVHRFWLAVPAALIEKVLPDLPPGWGLLGCTLDGLPFVHRKPETKMPDSLPWTACIGLLRAAADAGKSALWRAEERGRQRGIELGKAEAALGTPEGAAQREVERLRAKIAAFESASGLTLQDRWDGDLAQLGLLVRMAQEQVKQPGWLIEQLERETGYAVEAAERLLRQAKEARAAGQKLASVFHPAAASPQ